MVEQFAVFWHLFFINIQILSLIWQHALPKITHKQGGGAKGGVGGGSGTKTESEQQLPLFMTEAGMSLIPKVAAGEHFQVFGELSQIVHMVLQPGQSVQAEPGSMVYQVQSSIKYKITLFCIK